MKNKNIRALLKQQSANSSFDKLSRQYKDKNDAHLDNNKSSEVEISFNITPEEDELKKSINQNNNETISDKKKSLTNEGILYLKLQITIKQIILI